MRVAVYLAAVFLGATATPSGYYHQQYNYKTSSSSYKNNELQHKTDDQGSYSKDGDLEGRTRPKVSSNSEHSEYVNPQLRERLNAGYLDAETDLTSHGNMLANSYGASIGGGVSSGYHAGSQHESDMYEGVASSDHIGGATGVYGAYGSGSSQSSYGSSSSLRTVASRLQNDLQHEIQDALRSQSRYSHQADISDLEAELRRNLTARLSEILQEQYGTQTIRGGQSYSLSGGRLQTRPNYEQHELENLQRQVENSLLQQLRTSYSSSHQSYSQNYAHYESTTTYRPTTYRPIYPNLNVITSQRPFPEYPGGSKDSYYSQNNEYSNRVSSNVRYTPVPNPLSITTIASNVQSQLDNQLNRLLEQAQRQYFSEDSVYSVNNLDLVLERLRQELRENITYALDRELQSQYGMQVKKNNYMFSVGSGGETSGQYNYNVADLENLRRQVESNLLTKLNRDFESARQRWITTQQSQRVSYGHSQSSDYQYGSSSNNQRYEYSTPRYSDDGDYYRPTSASIVPLINSGVKGNQYQSISGSRQSSYGSSGSIVELQRHLQTDLSRQLQAAISQNKASMGRYSTGGYGGTFEEAYQRLYDDLQRNLTQQLQEYEAGSSGYSDSYGTVSDAQLASLKSQLQRNLASQLQTGLQQSYSASASYSASSGSSASAGAGAYSSSNSGGAYRTARGSDNYHTGFAGYGQYRSGGSYPLEGEDCQGDDPNAYHNHRSKRSYGYRSRPLGLSTHSGSGYGDSGYGGYNTGYNGNFGGYRSSGYGGNSVTQQPFNSVGQEEDNSDTIQEVEPIKYFTGQQEIDVGQQVDGSDDTQQVEIDHGFVPIELGSQNKLQNGSQQPLQLGQEPEAEGTATGNFQSGRQFSQSNRKPSNQYNGIDGYGKIELGSESHISQQVDNSDVTQQEQIGFGFSPQNPREPYTGISANVQSHNNLGQEVDDSDLTQQVEDINFENPSQPQLNRKPFEYGSNIQTNRKPFEYDSNIGTTEVASSHLSNFGSVGSQFQSTTQKSLRQFGSQPIGQEIDNTHTIQYANQVSDNGKLGVGSLVQTSTKKPLLNVGSNPETVQTNSQQNPLHQELDRGDISLGNNFQVSRETNRDAVFNPQLEDNSFGNLGTLDLNNNHKTVQAGQERGLNDNEYTSNYFVDLNIPSSLSTWDLPAKEKEVFMQIETNLTQQLENTIKNDISYSIAPSQLYQNILHKWQNNINRECQRLLKDHSYSSDIEQRDAKKLDKYLKTILEKKIQQELQIYGFSRESLGISSFSHQVHQSNFNTQNTNFESSLQYGSRYHQNFGRYSPKPASSNDFIQSEVSSQSGTNNNNDRLLTNQHTNYLPTLNEFSENNRQLYGSNGQVSIHYTTTTRPIYLNRNPWNNAPNYPGYTAEIGKPENIPVQPLPPKIQPHLEGDSKSSLTTPQSFERPITNTEIVTLKDQSGYIQFNENPKPIVSGTELDQKPLQETNNQWLDIGPPDSVPTFPVENQVFDYETNGNSKPADGNPLVLQPSSSNNPLDLSNFPPLPPPENSGSVIPAIQPQGVIPQQPSLPQTPTNWQTNINERQRHDQRLSDAQRESDLLIEKFRAAEQNRRHQQESINSYESHHGSTTYNHRTTNQHYPRQYEIIQVKLENITPEQLKIINEIDEDFTEIIETAVQNQIQTESSFQKSLKDLETELKTNLTDCIEGNFYPPLEATDVHLNKYSDLISQKFEANKIPDLKKYLEIKLIKKIRAQLKKAYKVDNEETSYEFQHGSRTHSDRRLYQSPSEVIQEVNLENLTPQQSKIINQIESDLTKQIEADIQSHLSSVTTQYLSSSENYQTLFIELQKQLKNNITELVQGASEPGLSKYSDLITGNFDQSKIATLEKYFEIKLTKNLKESLKTYFNINVAGSSSFGSSLNSGSFNYNRGYQHYQNSHHYGAHYGQTNDFNSPTEKAIEIEPIEFQHANVIVPASPSYSKGVKGGKIRIQNLETPAIQTSYNSQQNSQPNVDNLPEPVEVTSISDEIGELTTERAGWWQRFGNKVKQGASSLKKKIVGES